MIYSQKTAANKYKIVFVLTATDYALHKILCKDIV